MPSPPSHPYYPLDANVVGYEPNQTPVLELLISAGGACTILLGATFALASYVKPALRMTDRIAILWFVLCKAPRQEPVEGCMLTIWGYIAGALHCFFEGYFMFHHSHMASAQDLFGQLWKEYALSDSRYMTSDTLVLCMETMTVLLWGPLCFVVAYLTATRHSLRHSIQVIVCMSHLYGDMLYYATSLFDKYVHGRPYSRPEPYYFWLYYFLMNFIWIVVPAYYLYHSISTISAALKRQAEEDKTK
ncbi:hypothetical protein PDIG_35970 [Penicillium digitatum PHI26]|uniref:EXPERA domain-containing protein n=1 Tax=Penicillium digitatum (strain PHI26 / CECT 20796) TaxID=1170229 RepID=K9FYY1_PEND2|nr:hypothetical protein PDIG_35970 [Penicillium digitatum PHI26]